MKGEINSKEKIDNKQKICRDKASFQKTLLFYQMKLQL